MEKQDEVKRLRGGIIAQVAVLFAIGVLLIGLLTFFTEQYLSTNTVKSQTTSFLSDISNEVVLTVEEYPADEWLMEYWYENAEELDIEYDADYTPETKTKEKCSIMLERHPGFQLEYATAEQIEALPPEDQKLYAEIVYSWLITRINEIKRTYDISFLYCVLTDDSYSYQYFLFSAADKGAKRGTKYEEVYTIGHTVEADEGLQKAMRVARENYDYLNHTGKYMDYYRCLYDIGDQHALIGVSYDASEMMDKVYKQTYRDTLNVVAGLLFLSLVCLILILVYVLKPLRIVQQNIRMYTRNKDHDTVTANLRELRLSNEIGVLSDDIISLVDEIDDYVNEIETITADRERIVAELSLASKIQLDMIPSEFPEEPEKTGVDIYGSMTPAKEVGGDFYDFYKVDEDHLALVMADVSGKGVPGALFMMTTKVMTENAITADNIDDPAQIVETLNEQICKHNEEEMFVTLWLGILDIRTGVVKAVNAGHEYPMIKQPEGSFEIMRDKHCFILGGMEGIKYKEYEFTMKHGAKLFLYTDGVPEATNADNEMFGFDRTVETLRSAEDDSPKAILQAVNDSVNEFIGDTTQFDDMTMLCVHYIGKQTV